MAERKTKTKASKGKAMAAKSSKKPVKKSNKKLPGFFSFRNKRFVILLIVVVLAAGIGSYVMYKRSSAATYKNVVRCSQLKITLRRGSSGPCVSSVQNLLNVYRSGWSSISVDGKFGSITEDRVRRFQSANGLVSDGIVGSKTYAKFQEKCDFSWKYYRNVYAGCYYSNGTY